MINLYMHIGSWNHGCEAIVRTTVNMLDKKVRLFSSNAEQDLIYELDKVCDVYEDKKTYYSKGSLKWLISGIQIKLLRKKDLAIKFIRSSLLKKVEKQDVCLSIGGDNYCYPETDIMAAINRNMKKKGCRLVLWGCSVEPALIENKEIAEDLASFDLITARETISYNALKKVNPHTVLVSDPAFLLDRIEKELPGNWIEGKMIGINASPLIMHSSKNPEMVMNAFKNLILDILNNSDYGIALIPHVVERGNDDREILNKLYETTGYSERVLVVPDGNCMEIKGYISKCRMFIGARTHATIAAYSCCIPTLVLGYSVKSRGIAKDIFGAEENYVLSVQNLTNSKELLEKFRWIMLNEDEIRQHLKQIMPQYISKAYIARDALNKLLERNKV